MLERKLEKGNLTFIIRQDGEQTIISCKGYETTNAHPTMDLKTKQYGYRVNDQEFIKKMGCLTIFFGNMIRTFQKIFNLSQILEING